MAIGGYRQDKSHKIEINESDTSRYRTDIMNPTNQYQVSLFMALSKDNLNWYTNWSGRKSGHVIGRHNDIISLQWFLFSKHFLWSVFTSVFVEPHFLSVKNLITWDLAFLSDVWKRKNFPLATFWPYHILFKLICQKIILYQQFLRGNWKLLVLNDMFVFAFNQRLWSFRLR